MYANYGSLNIFHGVQFFLYPPLTRKDMYFQKIIITYTNQFTFIFLKFLLWVMNKRIFNFQKVTSMYKSYAYQIFNYVV